LIVWIGSISTLAGADAIEAARPLITDDARIVDAQACQLESYVREMPTGAEFWALPACNPTGNLEWTVGGNWIRMSGEPDTSHLVLQGKTILKPVQTNDWGWGVALGMQDVLNPRASRQVNDIYLNVPITFSLADDTAFVHINGGVDRDRLVEETKITWGVATEVAVADKLAIVAETFGDNHENPFIHGGVRIWIIPERWQVDATAGAHLGMGHSGTWVSIGIRLLSPPFL
jgi:hypothetical protein